VTAITRFFVDRCALFLAQGCGLGWAPRAPGTFGSLGGLLLVWGLQSLNSPAWYWSLEFAVIAVGIWLCTRAGQLLGRADPPSVVWDEITAFPIVFIGVPLTPVTAILGFAWFRLFDISKPWPIPLIERLPRGWGVMLDDLFAAVYSALGLHLTLWLLTKLS